jgi:hypothetical protein
MKVVLKVIILSLLCLLPGLLNAAPFFEGSAGILAADASQAPVYGIRGGSMFRDWEVSLGYWRAIDVRSDQMLSGSLDLHTVSLEAYRVFPEFGWSWKVGGGAGYTIPNLSDGKSEMADNDVSWIAGAGAEYNVNKSVALELAVKAFFFRTDTHSTTYGAHGALDTTTGETVFVVDPMDHTDSVNFNSALITVAVKFR